MTAPYCLPYWLSRLAAMRTYLNLLPYCNGVPGSLSIVLTRQPLSPSDFPVWHYYQTLAEATFIHEKQLTNNWVHQTLVCIYFGNRRIQWR